jgi:HK97 family phage portal protein
VRIGPFTIQRHKQAGGQALVTQWPIATGGGFWPLLRESFAGAWQRGIRVPVQDALAHPTFWACVTLIAGDIAKLRLKLIREDDHGICQEISNPAYSPVLKKPNHYQNRIQFLTYWILSLLTRGNAYALKERNHRGGEKQGTVDALYLLDPTRVQPMVAPSGAVYYAIQQDVLSGVTEASLVVPASEIIHDRIFPLYHPLCGLSPVYACGHAAVQGLKIIHNTTKLFENGTQLGGILTTPQTISEDTQKRFEKYWQENYAGEHNVGKIAMLGNDLKFSEFPAMNAVDAQLIDQLKWGDEKICSVFHVPPYMVGVGSMPTYNNIEALNQQFYSQCLQLHIESLELCLKEGLEIADPLYIESDLAGLLRMDSATKMKTATDGVRGGIYTPNEARAMFDKGPVAGGDTIYLQEQDHALEALAKRDAGPDPFGKATSTPPPTPALPAPQKAFSLDRVLTGIHERLHAAA